jgi:hypothetical protein
MEELKEYVRGSLPSGELGELRERYLRLAERVYLRKFSLDHLTPHSYLSSIEPYMSGELITEENYGKIKRLASYFSPNITSFFGFETRLGSPNTVADYLFAISSKRGEREAFSSFLLNENAAQRLLQKPEWQHLRNFAQRWVDSESQLFTNILGLWLEFDIAESSQEVSVPCVFIHTIPLRISSEDGEQKYDWVFQDAIPLLLGHTLPYPLHHQILQALRLVPEGSSVMDIGFMLSRENPGVRLVFKHLQPSQIIPYLESLGWSDSKGELSRLIDELQQQVTRLVLHICITEYGVDPKIGLECSFSPDRYHLEDRWTSFFEYLHQKGVCCQEKKTEVLDFLGISNEDSSQSFDLSSYKIAVLLPSEKSASTMVRYLSHVKLSYQPGRPLEAKAYPGVRLFGCVSSEVNQDVC